MPWTAEEITLLLEKREVDKLSWVQIHQVCTPKTELLRYMRVYISNIILLEQEFIPNHSAAGCQSKYVRLRGNEGPAAL